MDKNFQDRIDKFLLHGDELSEEEKVQFLKEVEEDTEKKEQYELTRNVKAAITSRVEKLKAMETFQRQYENELLLADESKDGTYDLCAMQESESPDIIENEKKATSPGRKWLWITGIAVVVVVGIFAIGSYFTLSRQSAPGNMRGDEEIFDGTPALAAPDTINSDTIYEDMDIKGKGSE
ncbi:MAG: hypothetical protein LUC91_09065 [Prevotella sp.]|nr:hypothetical protein [Prevotella sp.]